MVQTFANADDCANAIIGRVGRDIRMAIPVGIGKPNSLVNSLYAKALADPTLKLTIFTGLTLVRPPYKHELEKRFVAPLLDRLFASYPDLAYADDVRRDRLPDNIEIHEFFMQAGAWVGVPSAQRNYVSLGYIDVARHLQRSGVNVFAQLVAPPSDGSNDISLSSNTDVALDMKGYIAGQRKRGRPIVVACEFNENLPFMEGRARQPLDDFDFALSPGKPHFELFAPPKMPVALADYAMALHIAPLIKDGGTLQIGIGAFGDALTHALVLRHTRNDVFRDLVRRLGADQRPGIELHPFRYGLYGCSELLVDGFLALRDAGILTRTVMGGPHGDQPLALHAAFIVGCRAFYERLRTMPDAERRAIGMTAVSFTNGLLGQEKLRRAHRRDARFVNTALMATLLGSVISDQIGAGQVISGIGGQSDFVTMARQLDGARSIIALHSHHTANGKTSSNVTWEFPHASVPRHLRDIIVTEYGIADLRGRCDRDCIAAMLAISDHRFQDALMREAQKAGKLEKSFRLQTADNSAAAIAAALEPARETGQLPQFPLGTEMTPVEQNIANALATIKERGVPQKLIGGIKGMMQPADPHAAELQRMGLDQPDSLKERFWRGLIVDALRA